MTEDSVSFTDRATRTKLKALLDMGMSRMTWVINSLGWVSSQKIAGETQDNMSDSSNTYD